MRGAAHRLGARCSRRGAPASRSSPPITAPMARSVRSRPPITASWRRGDRVIANSRYTAAVIEARAPRAKDRIRVIYRGVDRNVFDPAAVDAQDGRHTQGCLGRSARHQDRAACRAAHQHQGAARPDRRRGARQCRGRAPRRCGHFRRRRAWTRRLSRGADRAHRAPRPRRQGTARRTLPGDAGGLSRMPRSRSPHRQCPRPSGAPAPRRKPWAVP